MKLKLIFATGAAAISAIAVPTWGADKAVERREENRDAGRARMERLGPVQKASEVVGMEIKNLQSEKLGKVDELALDVESGRIMEVIVSSGGILGIGDKTLAVPPQAFRTDLQGKTLRLDMSKDKLRSAPTFTMSKWDEEVRTNAVADIYRYYGHEPYFNSSRRDAQPAAMGRIEKSSKVIGASVKNMQDDKLGKVDNLLVDLEAGRIVTVVISSGGFLGLGDELSAVPPTRFRYDLTDNELRLNVTKDELASAPHFKSKEWPNVSDPVYISDVYRAYKIEPYFSSSDRDNTRRNVRDRDDLELDQGPTEADRTISRRIRQELSNQPGLSLNARSVRINTANGKITLRGAVTSANEKRMVEDVANRVAPQYKVDNELDVK